MVVETGAGQLTHESPGVTAGNLLWVSGQIAGDENGLVSGPDGASQTSYAFDRIKEICEAAGTDLSQLLQVRAFVTDIEDSHHVYDVLRERVPREPPTVAVTTVPEPATSPAGELALEELGGGGMSEIKTITDADFDDATLCARLQRHRGRSGLRPRMNLEPAITVPVPRRGTGGLAVRSPLELEIAMLSSTQDSIIRWTSLTRPEAPSLGRPPLPCLAVEEPNPK